MKIDLDWIQKELDAGRKVELEGRNGGFIINDNYVLNIKDECMVVSYGVGKMRLPPDSFKYFRIKRPAPIFEDLIDVAVKAARDGVIFSAEIFEDSVFIFEDSNGYDCNKPTHSIIEDVDSDIREIPKIISHINSLYTETFVIESEEDIERVSVGAHIELMNGNDDQVLYKSTYKGAPMIQFSNNKHWGALGLFILKGATVTQQKGNK